MNLGSLFRRLQPQIPVLVTLAVTVVLYIAAGIRYPAFFTFRVAGNMFSDNAFLGVVALGQTFVILTGGIDLSVGSMAGFASILMAVLVERHHWHPLAAIFACLLAGGALGFGQGAIINRFRLPPFLITLGGLFFLHGAALWISEESVQIDHPFFDRLVGFFIPLPGRGSLPTTALVFIVMLVVTVWLARQSRFGRAVYAIGGNPVSAELMGIRTGPTIAAVYALSGFCAALGGIVFALYTSSGNAISGNGLELQAIAAVVIGGTLLSGGYGSILGTLMGVLILGIVQLGITFDGRLSSWWKSIVIGALLLIFVLAQRGLERALVGRAE